MCFAAHPKLHTATQARSVPAENRIFFHASGCRRASRVLYLSHTRCRIMLSQIRAFQREDGSSASAACGLLNVWTTARMLALPLQTARPKTPTTIQVY